MAEAAQGAAAPPPPLRGGGLMAAALLLSLANFMVVLDTTIANVSVPHIAGGLAVSPAQGTWVITSYSVAEAITVPLTGWLVQRFGAVKVFIFAMLGFGVFSFACGLAPSFSLLVAFRVLQGLCGGPIMPTSQTLLLYIFPREKGAQAIGIWSMTTVIAPIAGPTLGGLISDSIGWNWIFFINIPVAIGVAFGSFLVLTSRETPTRKVSVDAVGLALLIAWVGSLQIMLDKGKELEWFSSPVIVALAIVAAVGFVVFIVWELTAENPIVNLKVFRHRGFVAGVIVISLTFGTFFSSVVLIPLWLQTTMGYTATEAGYVSSLNGVFAVIMSPIVARLLGKFDARALVSFGVGSMALIAIWRSTFTTDASFVSIALPFLAQGFVIPFFFIPGTAITLGSVRPEETASAAGLSNFLRTTSAAFATSIMTTAWDNTATAKRAVLAGRLNGFDQTVSRLVAHGLTPAQASGQIDRMLQIQAVMLSTNEMFFVSAFMFMIAASVVWLAPKRRGGGSVMGGH